MSTKGSSDSEFNPRGFSAQQKLIIGWQQSYDNLSGLYQRIIGEVRDKLHIEGYHDWAISRPQCQFLDLCVPSRFSAETAADFGAGLFRGGIKEVTAFIKNNGEFQRLLGWPADVLDLCALVLELGRFHSSTTCSGTKVLWFDTTKQQFDFVEPVPTEFPDWFDVVDYWHRLPRFQTMWDLGVLVTAHDVPIDLTPTATSWARFPTAEDPAKSETVADALLDEAYINKRWVIPNKALVQPPFGPFTHFEAVELGNSVYFVGRNERGEFATFGVDVDTKFFYFPYRASGQPFQSIASALKLILSAIVRDFWVVEERDKVFEQKNPKRVPGVRIHRAHGDDPRIVYLPRVHYKEKPDVEQCAKQLEQSARAAHQVHAHARRAINPSEQQLMLAQKYGFPLATGYTFVRPHERGNRNRQTIYRSRSALQSLFVSNEIRMTSKIRWFAFEKEVEALMVKLGFEVQHRAASRSGDNGIDLYATKGSDLEMVNWIIQCKCYNPHRPVGPNVVHELHGVLGTYPRGTHGMIVTTSRFTEGAKRLAAELNIRLMDGHEFVARVGRPA